jgi:serine/threonine protein kinase/WD40 repeat protein
MTPSPPDNEAIFHAARDIPDPDRRREFVREACGGDEARLAEVTALLAAAEAPDSLLDRPSGSEPVAAISQPSPQSPGAVIGPYKLIEQIGEGGMGTVWMAQQTTPVRRLVAVKLIKAGMDSRQVIARFEAERQALALMDHANIARVLDAGTTSAGRPYFVMDLVKGVPITRYCDEHHLTPRQRLELFIPVCQAIQHAHQKAIIHRDLKPSNVLIALYDGKPVPKVIDFGVAKATGQSLTDKTLVTGFGNIVGTLEYMSPEQAELNQLDIDTRSDIYSLGVLLYELLAGSPPFSRKDLDTAGMLEMLRVIREQEPTKPSTKLSSADALLTLAANRGTEPARLTKLLRGELDWIVMKCLEKDRNRRYETANGLATDLRRYLDDEPVQACPPSAAYRFRKFARRNKLALATGVVVASAVLLAVTLAFTYVRVRRETRAKEIAARRATDSLWLSLYEQARACRLSRQMGQRLNSLEAITQAAQLRIDERLRDEAIAAMALPDVRLGPTWNTWPPGYDAWHVDGDYRLIARSNDKGLISIVSLADDRAIQNIVSTPTRRGYVMLSPDGRYVANLEAEDALKVWRVADKAPVLRAEPQQTQGYAFSSDSRHLAIGQQGWILRFNLATGQELNRWQLPDGRHANDIAFAPDDQRLAVGYQNSSFSSVHNAQSGTLVARLPVGPMVRQVVAWHPDGERLAVAGSDPRIQIWNVPAASKIATLEGHLQEIVRLSFHPGGSLLGSESWDGTVRLWDPATGRQLLQFSGNARCHFSRDGRWLGLALRAGQAQLLEVAPTREYRTLSFGPATIFGAHAIEHDISPDGRILAQAVYNSVCLFHLATGRALAVLPPGRPLFQSNRELLIAGEGGLARWPIQPGPAAGELRIGPPRTVTLPAQPLRAARSADGRMLAIVSEQAGTGLLVDLATNSVRPERFDHAAAGFIALSPDGRWLATSGWRSQSVRLWAVETQTMVKEWRLPPPTMVFFTPDSRGLITSDEGELRIWDVATQGLIRPIRRDVAGHSSYVAFSPDGGLMALEMAPGIIDLKDAATARTVARLEDPHGDAAGWISFSPDGTQLVVTAVGARAVHIWDLRLIRQRLAKMRLDWDAPPYPPADPECQANQLLKITVLHAAQGRPELLREQKARQEIEARRRALEANPDSPTNCNNLAWVYLTGPEALRDVKAALPLAEKAARIVPGEAVYSNTLGLAYYRAGQFAKAIGVLRPNLDRQKDEALALDLFFLAMSHHRSGETARARDYYDWAIRWIGAQGRLSAEDEQDLKMFRAEAEEVLRINQK